MAFPARAVLQSATVDYPLALRGNAEKRKIATKRLCLLVLSNGAVYHTQRWVDYFVDCGDEVHLASLDRCLPTRATAHKLPSIVPIHALRYPLTLPWVQRLYRRFRPDVIVAHFVPAYGFLGALMRRHPLVCVVWGSDVLINPSRTPFHLWRARYSLERTDLVFSDAEMLSRRVTELGARPERIETLTFGVDTARFRPLEGPRPDPPIVLSTRQLLPPYYVDLLIRAVPEIVKRTEKPFEVRIIGEGSEREGLEALAASLGVSERVTFVGGGLSEDRLTAEIQRASIYVSTTRSDSTSVSLLEAMACGVPPVVTDIEGNREWIESGENGVLVPVEPPEPLADAIAGLLEDPRRGRDFAERNLLLVRRRGDWKRNMARTRLLIYDLVSGARRE